MRTSDLEVGACVWLNHKPPEATSFRASERYFRGVVTEIDGETATVEWSARRRSGHSDVPINLLVRA